MTTLTFEEAKNILGLSNAHSINDNDVKKAFKLNILKLHPDTNGGKENTDDIEKLIEAKNILINSNSTKGTFLLPVSLCDLLLGNTIHGFDGICFNCQGLGISKKENCDKCNGTGGLIIDNGSLRTRGFCSNCNGTGIIETSCPYCNGGKKRFDNKIKIPAGTPYNTEFKLNNANVILIQKKEKMDFTFEKTSIYKDLHIPWTMMITGGIVSTKTPTKKIIDLKIKESARFGEKIIIPNLGFNNKDGSRGSLIYRIFPEIPRYDTLSKATKLSLKYLSRQGL